MKTAFRVALALLISLSLCVCLIPSASAAGTISSNSIEKAIAYAYNEKNTNPDDWKGWCAAFVWECYNKGAGLSNRSYATAREMGDALITHTDANPPRGAFVFWYKTSNPYGHAGHVGLSLGDGTVIHAYSSIKVTSISTVNNGGYTYRGWGAPISGYTLETEDAPTELTLTGAVYPTGHYDSLPNFGLRGIFNSPGTITEVNATISTQSGGVYMNYTKNWNSSTYNIQTDGLNNQFTFRDLPDGFYQYYVEARDNYGKTASVSSWFSIGTITYSSLDFSSCPNLLLLSCWDNMLTHLKINQSAGLQRLFCYQNQLRYLDINANTILAQMVQNSAPTIENGVISYSETDNASYAYYLRFDEGTKLITVLVPDFILPSSLTAIEDEAFSGGAFTYVVLPDGAETIGWHAFADCPKLAYIYIPASVTSIDENAFDGAEGLTIFGAPESAASEYAGQHGFTFAAQQ